MGLQLPILTSDIFGLRSTLDKETLSDVERLRFLAAQPARSPAEEVELSKLNVALMPLGFSRELRDPLFKEFVHEMALVRRTAPDVWGRILTSDERTRRSGLVADIVKKLRARQDVE